MTKPPELWRQLKGHVHPEPFLVATEDALAAFEADLGRLRTPSDDEVLDVVKRVVLALNDIAESHEDGDFDTVDREELCDYIDITLGAAGIDVDALATRQGIGEGSITDRWRDW
ncbi:hypothetical protein Misp01_48630 [Microtetraspora sp. NBRC 13810]|uniref:hypothetical protein n=1 Tax=Microtetraspora sp. NBRC 13810 TaxID=3030990 RepID=UPI0024A46165|nr:hypothetical protein [Microtetraspora sp. NBRC 13810]GLW09734.1 hypothetical protein Misp01_48630 [Microtetraspora sp. NBRC 13810]